MPRSIANNAGLYLNILNRIHEVEDIYAPGFFPPWYEVYDEIASDVYMFILLEFNEACRIRLYARYPLTMGMIASTIKDEIYSKPRLKKAEKQARIVEFSKELYEVLVYHVELILGEYHDVSKL